MKECILKLYRKELGHFKRVYTVILSSDSSTCSEADVTFN